VNLRDAYYEARFENAFLRAKGTAFQEFFERLMSLAYKADFMPCRPWGNRGDRKNDGFLKSERRLFQVYAPYGMEEKKAIAKISDDFAGARTHWGTWFGKWAFVHNAVDGLPPHVQSILLQFEQDNPGITVEPWGLEELRRIFRRLHPDDLSSWLGLAPTEEAKAMLAFADLRSVLESLAGKATPCGAPVKAVPPGKIEANDLSESVATLIKNGMAKAPLVSAFLDQWHDETLGERLAASFRAEYGRLQETLHPNLVFSELQAWVGGRQIGTAEHQMAVLTVLAYYFERCDIFREPRAAPA
jgi:hypothetical protein